MEHSFHQKRNIVRFRVSSTVNIIAVHVNAKTVDSPQTLSLQILPGQHLSYSRLKNSSVLIQINHSLAHKNTKKKK